MSLNFNGLKDPNSFDRFGGFNEYKEAYEKLGFIQVGVFGEGKSHSFNYTVGLMENHNTPELILVSLNPKVAATIINIIVHDICNNGLILEPFKVYEQFSNFKLCLVPISDKAKKELMTVTNNFYEDKNSPSGFEAYQIIWTDTNNKFPWEEGFDETFRENAILLFDGETFEKAKDIK